MDRCDLNLVIPQGVWATTSQLPAVSAFLYKSSAQTIATNLHIQHVEHIKYINHHMLNICQLVAIGMTDPGPNEAYFDTSPFWMFDV